MLPWKDTNPENEQVRFIERFQAGEVTFVDACRQFSISRKTGYKRLQRFRPLVGTDWEIGPMDRTPKIFRLRSRRAELRVLIPMRRLGR